jgi:hypothetical protein
MRDVLLWEDKERRLKNIIKTWYKSLENQIKKSGDTKTGKEDTHTQDIKCNNNSLKKFGSFLFEYKILSMKNSKNKLQK